MNIYCELLDLIRMYTGPTPLERVLETIGKAVDDCDNAITRAQSSGGINYINAVIDDECDVVENLFGAAVVTCQAVITAVVSHVERIHERASAAGQRLASSDGSKAGIRALGSPSIPPSQYSRIQVIDAFANYFKHRDEWDGPWTQFPPASREAKTVAIITATGAKQGSTTGNMRTGITSLGISNYRNLTILYDHIASWANNVATAYESELRRFNLI